MVRKVRRGVAHKRRGREKLWNREGRGRGLWRRSKGRGIGREGRGPQNTTTEQIRGGALGGEDEGVALGMAWLGLSSETAVVLCLPFEG